MSAAHSQCSIILSISKLHQHGCCACMAGQHHSHYNRAECMLFLLVPPGKNGFMGQVHKLLDLQLNASAKSPAPQAAPCVTPAPARASAPPPSPGAACIRAPLSRVSIAREFMLQHLQHICYLIMVARLQHNALLWIPCQHCLQKVCIHMMILRLGAVCMCSHVLHICREMSSRFLS